MINIGGNIGELYVNSTKIAEAYVGSQLVYEPGGGLPDGYVQDSLVFWLDGADCLADTWVDKVSGNTLTRHGASVSISDGGVTFTSNAAFCSTDITLPTYNTSTIELVAILGGGSTQNMLLYSSDTNSICYSYNAGSTKCWIRPAAILGRTTITPNTIGTQSVSTSFNYINKVLDTVTGTNVQRGAGYCTSVGAWVSNSSYSLQRGFRGTIYQIRIYNRQLSEAEIFHNQDLDISKYNIL